MTRRSASASYRRAETVERQATARRSDVDGCLALCISGGKALYRRQNNIKKENLNENPNIFPRRSKYGVRAIAIAVIKLRFNP